MATPGDRHALERGLGEEGRPAAFVLDQASILERLGGDEDIYTVMVDMFLEDVENNCRALAGAIVAGDARTLSREAHTVKGLLAMFSDDFGVAQAFRLECQAKAGDLAGLDAAVASLQGRLREVAAALR